MRVIMDTKSDFFNFAARGMGKGYARENELVRVPDLPDVIPRGWFQGKYGMKHVHLSQEGWIAERLRQAAIMLRDCIECNPNVRGGVPVLKGTRVPVARILADIADGMSAPEVA